jgi:tetratricopeptide (TPR) repeat protein
MREIGRRTGNIEGAALLFSLMTLFLCGAGFAPRSALAQPPDEPSRSAATIPADLESSPEIRLDEDEDEDVLPADLESSPEIRPDEEVLPDKTITLHSLTQKGIRLVKRGEYAEAISLLEPHRDAANFSLLHALGIAYVRTQRNQEAYDVLLRAHNLNSEDPGPLLPAALACARMAKSCDEYRRLALQYKERGGKFVRLADKIADYQPVTLSIPKRF